MDISFELSAPYLSGDNSSCQVSGIYPYPIRGIQTGYRSLKPINTDLGREIPCPLHFVGCRIRTPAFLR